MSSESSSRSSVSALNNSFAGNSTCQVNEELSINIEMPPKPEEPSPEDCCGQGCQPCIFDIYHKQLSIWEAECEKLRLKGVVQTFAPVAISPVAWSQFVCAHIEPHTVDSKIYTFESSMCNVKLQFLPGQYLLVKCGGLKRAYTPLPADYPNQFKIVVKFYPDGRMSSFFQVMEIGSIVDWSGPFETGFCYKPNTFRHLVMFCAGTGLAPCYVLAHSITADENDDTSVRIVFSCHTRNNLLLRNFLKELRAYWNFSMKTFLTQDDGIGFSKWYGEDISSGRISADVVAKELVGKCSVCVVVCGTKSFNKDIAGYVTKSQVPENNIHIL